MVISIKGKVYVTPEVSSYTIFFPWDALEAPFFFLAGLGEDEHKARRWKQAADIPASGSSTAKPGAVEPDVRIFRAFQRRGERVQRPAGQPS